MIARLAHLMPALTPWQFWTLASFGGLLATLIALSVGGRGGADDDADGPPGPIPLFDRDSLLVEVMTRTPEGYRFAAPAAARHDGDCRTRSVHPAT